jgi:hypothetical protein
MFSNTVMESNSAPLWKSIPNFLRTRYSSSSGRSVMSSSSTMTRPSSGASRPSMWRRVTDLPVPEPPRMTITSPR